MATKDYYAILGVSPSETPEGIRAAYRRAVQRTHPDHAGPEGAAAFQEVVEAHSVLSDPERRRAYDESLRRAARRQSSLDAYAAAVARAFEPTNSSQVAVEITLAPEEALFGGVLSFPIGFYSPCPMCGGAGRDWFFPCLYCGGAGEIAGVRSVTLRIPPGLSPGAVRDFWIQGADLPSSCRRVRIRVSPQPPLRDPAGL
jgi:DnaJ-class molecular chaperone